MKPFISACCIGLLLASGAAAAQPPSRGDGTIFGGRRPPRASPPPIRGGDLGAAGQAQTAAGASSYTWLPCTIYIAWGGAVARFVNTTGRTLPRETQIVLTVGGRPPAIAASQGTSWGRDRLSVDVAPNATWGFLLDGQVSESMGCTARLA